MNSGDTIYTKENMGIRDLAELNLNLFLGYQKAADAVGGYRG